MSWVDVGALEDVPLRGARLVRTRAGCVAVYRTAEAEIFATADACPHRGGPLSEGIVHGRKVTCPLHNHVFSLETGEGLGPDGLRVATIPVRVEGGRILLDAAAVGARTAA